MTVINCGFISDLYQELHCNVYSLMMISRNKTRSYASHPNPLDRKIKQASGETALQKYRHAGTLKQACLGVWGMHQHGESTRSCERPPPRQGHKKEKFGAETTARNSWSCASSQLLKGLWMVDRARASKVVTPQIS